MENTIFLQDGFNPGGIKDRVDNRDWQWSEVATALSPFDWNKGWDVEVEVGRALNMQGAFKLPVKDQNGSGSCGGQAWANYGGAIEAVFTNSFEERSAKFIYSQTYVNVPGGGSAGRDNCNVVVKQGWGKEALTPSYDNRMAPSEAFMERPQDITDAARQDAKLAKALAYVNTGVNIDTIAQAAEANHGAIIGLTGANNGTWASSVPTAPIAGQQMWNHWLYVGRAGIIGGKKAVCVLNSWGTWVGDNGWQWITEDYFKGLGGSTIWSGWTHTYNNQPIDTNFSHDFQINMELGQKSTEIMALQRALQVLGYFPASVNPTTYYGTITASAVYKFQVDKGVTPADRNHAGPKTRAALNAIFNK